MDTPGPLDLGKPVMRQRYWMPITHAQLVSGIVVLRALAAVYPVQRNRIVTHGSIAPQRRVDPGPALPLDLFLREVFSGADLSAVKWLKDFAADPGFMRAYWAGKG